MCDSVSLVCLMLEFYLTTFFKAANLMYGNQVIKSLKCVPVNNKNPSSCQFNCVLFLKLPCTCMSRGKAISLGVRMCECEYVLCMCECVCVCVYV